MSLCTKVAVVLAAWFVLSVPVGILVGRFLKRGLG